MLLGLQLLGLCFFMSLLHILRSEKLKKSPIRRYHPTTFYSSQNNDEPDTAADDVHYAYGGGESHAGEVTSPHQDNDHQESAYQPEVEVPHLAGDFHAEPPHQPGYKPAVHYDDYHSVVGHQSDDFRHSGYHEDPGYGYHYDEPAHDHHHDLSLGYHYLPPPAPALPAHPVAETPKQTPPQLFTYYYLGRHLWYIPLYFSIYFIIYVGALVLKAIARHKIEYPINLQVAAAHLRAAKALEDASKKFYM